MPASIHYGWTDPPVNSATDQDAADIGPDADTSDSMEDDDDE
jgi:hypothetical protein